MLRSAVRDRLIGFNPCDGVRLPPVRRKDTDDQVVTPDELVNKLLPATPDQYRALVALAGGTGLRWGECTGLCWDAIDLAAATLRVVRVAEEVAGHVRLKPYPKSRAGRRSVPIPGFAMQLLTEHARAFGSGDAGLVFTTSTGRPVRRGTFRSRVWKPSLRRAGLPVELRFHDLRHSYATWLVSDGVPINDVAKIMGHEQNLNHAQPLHPLDNRAGSASAGVLRCLFAAFDLGRRPGYRKGALGRGLLSWCH